MAIIQIENYPVFMKIGCFKEEQLAGQDVLVSMTLDVGSMHQVGKMDEVSHTVNYADVMTTVDHLLVNKSVALIEKAVLILGEGILASFPRVSSTEISITKNRIPGGITKGASVSVSESFSRENL